MTDTIDGLKPIKLREALTVWIGSKPGTTAVMAEGYVGRHWALNLDAWKRPGALTLLNAIVHVHRIDAGGKTTTLDPYGWKVEEADKVFEARFEALRPLALTGPELATLAREISAQLVVTEEEEKKPVSG